MIADGPGMVKTLGMRLRANGFQIITAHDGAMAIALAQHEKPDLIVLDIKMSGKNGYSVFQDLRESVSARSIPIVFFSALPSEQAQVRLSSGRRTTEKERNSNNCSLKREYSGMCQ